MNGKKKPQSRRRVVVKTRVRGVFSKYFFQPDARFHMGYKNATFGLSNLLSPRLRNIFTAHSHYLLDPCPSHLAFALTVAWEVFHSQARFPTQCVRCCLRLPHPTPLNHTNPSCLPPSPPPLSVTLCVKLLELNLVGICIRSSQHQVSLTPRFSRGVWAEFWRLHLLTRLVRRLILALVFHKP